MHTPMTREETLTRIAESQAKIEKNKAKLKRIRAEMREKIEEAVKTTLMQFAQNAPINGGCVRKHSEM